VDFAWNEEQEALREQARAFLAQHSSSEAVRRAMESEPGHDPDTWKRIGSELGWPGVIVPEAYGGIGLAFTDLVALLEPMGEALLCSPFFASVCLGANALLVAGNESQRAQHLAGIAEGRVSATLAFAGPDGASAGIRAEAAPDGGAVLAGGEHHVLDGHVADLVVVTAREAEGEGTDGLSLFLVSGDAEGLTRRVLPTLDQTRRRAELRLEGVRVPAEARLGEPGAAGPALRKILDRACVALAAEQVGTAQRCLDLAVAHAKERVQFGRPIGSFQAIKHKCADMMLLVESARSAAYYAGCIAADDTDELPAVASLAKAYASDAAFHCAGEALQIHGGVGFTWEYDVHLHLKRAQGDREMLGSPDFHRERVAREIGL